MQQQQTSLQSHTLVTMVSHQRCQHLAAGLHGACAADQRFSSFATVWWRGRECSAWSAGHRQPARNTLSAHGFLGSHYVESVDLRARHEHWHDAACAQAINVQWSAIAPPSGPPKDHFGTTPMDHFGTPSSARAFFVPQCFDVFQKWHTSEHCCSVTASVHFGPLRNTSLGGLVFIVK